MSSAIAIEKHRVDKTLYPSLLRFYAESQKALLTNVANDSDTHYFSG